MASNRSTLLPPFVPDELLFVVEDGQRDIDAEGMLDEVVTNFGGRMQQASRSLSGPTRIEAAQPLRVLSAESFPAKTPEDAYALFAQLDQQMQARGSSVIWQPNWVIGIAGEHDGGGGGGPGARPIPIRGEWATRPLPFRSRIVQPLQARAAQGNGTVRLIFLDAWNADQGESRRLAERPLYRFMNDYCLGETFQMRDYYASCDGDPFPMPDHGLFAAYLAGELIGSKRLWLHDTVQAQIASTLSRADWDVIRPSHDSAKVSVEAVRVLDEYGAGDSKRLIDALTDIAAGMTSDERVIINMSLVFNIPRTPPSDQFRDRWPGLSKRPDRLDRALHDAIRALHDKGALLFAAAGNSSQGEERRAPALFPAAYEEVVGVTAASYGGEREAYYANRVGSQDLAVFGGEVKEVVDADKRKRVVIDERYPLVGPFTDSRVPVLGNEPDPVNETGVVAWAGTSFATPLASGLATLLWSAHPERTASEIRATLLDLADGRLENGTPYIDLFEFD